MEANAFDLKEDILRFWEYLPTIDQKYGIGLLIDYAHLSSSAGLSAAIYLLIYRLFLLIAHWADMPLIVLAFYHPLRVIFAS